MYRNRIDAGQLLAADLKRYCGREDVVVLGIPRGGVPVAFQVAQALKVPLDVFLVRKLGAPGRRELAIGAIAGGNISLLNRKLIAAIGVPEQEIAKTIAAESAELRRREQVYHGIRPELSIADKTVILVDDGIATGSSMLAAVTASRKLGVRKIVVAAPVASKSAQLLLEKYADEVVCPLLPETFHAISEFYEDFSQVDDAEVTRILEYSLDLAHYQQAQAAVRDRRAS